MRPVSVAAGIVLAAVGLTLSACGGGDGSATGMHRAVSLIGDGEITTCTHLSYRPFEFKQGAKVVGFDVDMVDLVAEKVGVTQRIVDTPFEGIQSGADLNARKCDIAAAAITITPERQKKIAFSAAYFDADQALLVKKASGIKSLEALRGRAIGVLSATTGKLYAENHAPAGVRIKTYKDLTLLLRGVDSGQIAAAVNDIPVLLDYVKQHPQLQVAARFDTGEHYGLAMSKVGSHALRQTVNDAIRQARTNGTYDRIYAKWFGAKPR
jgi:polar amino acid transport system substrate-binding protein